MTVTLLPAIGINRETSIIHARTILREELYNFRINAFNSDSKRIYPGAEILSADKYDQYSLQILYENNKDIAGAARIVRTFAGKLPLCSLYEHIDIKHNDLELSRFITNFDRTGKKAFVYLLPVIAAAFMSLPIIETNCMIYADVLSGYPRTLNRNTYIEFGFEPTGFRSFDKDYALDSELFILRPERIKIFMSSVVRYQKYVGKLRLHSSITQETIQSVLLPSNNEHNIEVNAYKSKLRLFA